MWSPLRATRGYARTRHYPPTWPLVRVHDTGVPLLEFGRIEGWEGLAAYLTSIGIETTADALQARRRRYELPIRGGGTKGRPVHFTTGERPAAAGVWQRVKARGIDRCGIFDANWHDEVRTIAPGASVDLKTWLPSPIYAVDTQKAGRVRLRAHYEYRAKEPPREALEAKAPPRGLGDMGKIPPFHLVSNPIEFRIVRRLEIEADVVGKIRLGTERRLSELLALRVVNATNKPVALDPQRWDFALGNVFGVKTALNEGVGPSPDVLRKAKKRVLEPGASVPLIGPGALRPGRDIRLRFEGEPGAKVHARFVLIEGGGSRVRLSSPYIELEVAR